ncbi:bet1-like protein At4g14600 isoform X2 [Cryptomeria japonica]|uniref:bet1-like protein At4g14600 isoform X2 n=1 Tax=Cryptomeria japonica TaxID=3369 RepID=UPI0025AC478B|nr:bet1-like protein At4g14600 isoform X2 [Cryptomeria japonica]
MASFGTGPFHSRPGLSSRSNNAQSDEIQLRVDPIHGDIDDTISDLHHKVLGLRNVAQAIESETKFQNDFLSQLVGSAKLMTFQILASSEPRGNDSTQSSGWS